MTSISFTNWRQTATSQTHYINNKGPTTSVHDFPLSIFTTRKITWWVSFIQLAIRILSVHECQHISGRLLNSCSPLCVCVCVCVCWARERVWAGLEEPLKFFQATPFYELIPNMPKLYLPPQNWSGGGKQGKSGGETYSQGQLSPISKCISFLSLL